MLSEFHLPYFHLTGWAGDRCIKIAHALTVPLQAVVTLLKKKIRVDKMTNFENCMTSRTPRIRQNKSEIESELLKSIFATSIDL